MKDIVFVDTSVFIAENYFAPRSRVNTLSNLAKENIISLVSTEITNQEIIDHLKADVVSACNKVREFKALQSVKDFESYFDKCYKKRILAKVKDILKNFQDANKTHIIGYDFCNDIAGVFNLYFERKKPFGDGKKKSEFPDAFVLQMLENYCKKSGLKKIIILSTDSDMMKYESKYLIHKPYREYLTEKLAEANTQKRLRYAIGNNKQDICGNIKAQLSEELEDEWHYNGIFNAEEISEIEVVNCSVEMADDFYILSKDEKGFLVELSMRSNCEVKCTYFNLDYATYDREDDRWYGGEWETERLSGEEQFKINVYVSIDEPVEVSLDDFDIGTALPVLERTYEP